MKTFKQYLAVEPRNEESEDFEEEDKIIAAQQKQPKSRPTPNPGMLKPKASTLPKPGPGRIIYND